MKAHPYDLEFFALVAALLCFPIGARCESAALHTSRQTFLADLSGAPSTVDFEGLGSGTLVPNSSDLGGIALSQPVAGESMLSVERFDQTSAGGVASLGLTGGDDAFLSGDQILLVMDRPTLAIGLYVIGSPGDVQAGDFQLVAKTHEVFNASTPDFVLPDGGEAYFLGIVVTDPDVDSAFTNAALNSLDSTGEGLYVFNIDDITLSLPGGDANLLVFKTGPGSAEPGTTITYSIVVANGGPEHAFEIELVDPAPPGFVFLYNANAVTGSFPASFTVLPDSSALVVDSTYQIPVNYTGPVVATNTITASSTSPDPVPGLEFASVTTIINPSGDRDADQLSNEQELMIGTNPELADTDGDGQPDGAETVADTDPIDDGSFLAVNAIRNTEGAIQIDWQGGVFATQVLESISDPQTPPGQWIGIFTNHPPTPIDTGATDTNGSQRTRAYRVRIP